MRGRLHPLSAFRRVLHSGLYVLGERGAWLRPPGGIQADAVGVLDAGRHLLESICVLGENILETDVHMKKESGGVCPESCLANNLG